MCLFFSTGVCIVVASRSKLVTWPGVRLWGKMRGRMAMASGVPGSL